MFYFPQPYDRGDQQKLQGPNSLELNSHSLMLQISKNVVKWATLGREESRWAVKYGPRSVALRYTETHELTLLCGLFCLLFSFALTSLELLIFLPPLLQRLLTGTYCNSPSVEFGTLDPCLSLPGSITLDGALEPNSLFVCKTKFKD